ncbi:unnamed protein product [Amoebophrya sp. A25]|nr:unnamed protein product [Amoebophrya sp. A25]|eukprot:GSA25T00011175001.1
MFTNTWVFLAHSIGCVALTWIAYQVFTFINICFLRPAKDLKKEFGEWAVITGATDGLGKAMALELSKKYKMKIVLISRTQARLDETAKELPTESATVSIDFSNFDQAARDKIKSALKDKDVGILINNVGISYEHPMFFNELPPERLESLVRLNIDSTNRMIQDCLPAMIEKKKGAIVNMASGAAICSHPLYAGYSACKEYIIRLTQCLAAEYEKKGVHFQVQYPHLVTSKLSKVKRPSLMIPSAEAFAKHAVKCIGYETELSPYPAHYLLCGLLRQLPIQLQNMIVMANNLPLRAKALKKAATSKTD